MVSKKFDFVIIGAGIVGLSVAKQLTEQFPRAKIALLEKESRIGKHASGRNSGVVHSGIYYPANSLKATVCREGARRMLDFAKEHHILYRANGKTIVATSETELPSLHQLLKNAACHQIKAELIDETAIHQLEPYAKALQGLHIPSTANIDSPAVLKKIEAIILSRGVRIFFNEKMISINKQQSQINTTKKRLSFGFVFNCAGAQTDKIAKLFGFAKEYRLLPFKGIYYKLKQEKNYLVSSNIYPVPDLNLPFLGVHFTKTVHDEVYIGPTAIPAFGRENYGWLQGISIESLRMMKDICLMYYTNHQHFRQLIHAEIKKYLKPHFMRTANKLINNLQMQDLVPCDKVGIRPQLINLKQRRLEMDYIIEQNERSLHVLNAISPAFTSAFCFSELLVKCMMERKTTCLISP